MSDYSDPNLRTVAGWRCRHPWLWNLLLIVALLLVLSVAAHFVMQLGTRHGARRTVPDFAGIRIDEAQRLAAEHDLKLFINDSLFVPAYEGGLVLDQLPEGGVEVKPGRTIYVTINSFREKRVPVPYVAGRSLRQAKNILEIAGLEIAQLIYRNDIATNYVLAEFLGDQAVHENSRLEAGIGSGVTLHVGVEPENNAAIVPLLVGMPLRQAKSRLWELGLNVGNVAFDAGINRLNEQDACVYVQTPAAEQPVHYGTPVALQLTLDAKKIADRRAAAEKEARTAAALRQREEEEAAESQAETAFREALEERPEARDNDEFFD